MDEWGIWQAGEKHSTDTSLDILVKLVINLMALTVDMVNWT